MNYVKGSISLTLGLILLFNYQVLFAGPLDRGDMGPRVNPATNDMLRVPGVVGMDYQSALASLQQSGLNPRIHFIRHRDKQYEGRDGEVVKQVPVAGSVAMLGSSVSINVYDPQNQINQPSPPLPGSSSSGESNTDNADNNHSSTHWQRADDQGPTNDSPNWRPASPSQLHPVTVPRPKAPTSDTPQLQPVTVPRPKAPTGDTPQLHPVTVPRPTAPTGAGASSGVVTPEKRPSVSPRKPVHPEGGYYLKDPSAGR